MKTILLAVIFVCSIAQISYSQDRWEEIGYGIFLDTESMSYESSERKFTVWVKYECTEKCKKNGKKVDFWLSQSSFYCSRRIEESLWVYTHYSDGTVETDDQRFNSRRMMDIVPTSGSEIVWMYLCK
jgi:hypothetical protein